LPNLASEGVNRLSQIATIRLSVFLKRNFFNRDYKKFNQASGQNRLDFCTDDKLGCYVCAKWRGLREGGPMARRSRNVGGWAVSLKKEN